MDHAIVTGHSRGLGAAIAETLLDRGARVLGLARHANADLARRFGTRLQQVPIDLADAGALSAWLAGDTLQAFLADAPRILLINNAGSLQPVGPLGSQDNAAIARTVALNVTAPLMLSNALLAASPTASDRRILHVSSGVGRRPLPGWSVYCATKAAIDHHARTVATDRFTGLRIASVAPGVVDTDMQAEIRATSLDRFPLRERFDLLKRNGELISPQACAQRVVEHLLSAQFGREPVADLRTLA